MISKNVNKFCKDDLSLIENYDKAINDNINVWDCHHRLETDLNVSQQYLISNNLYLNRPATELIFLTRTEHRKLHGYQYRGTYNLSKELRNEISIRQTGSSNSFYNHTHNTNARQSISKAQKEFQNKPVVKEKKSKRMKNNKLTQNFRWITNGTDNKFAHESKLNDYFNIGYYYGRHIKR